MSCRNYSEDCVNCQFKYQSLMECFDMCDVPDNVLEKIERKRNKTMISVYGSMIKDENMEENN